MRRHRFVQGLGSCPRQPGSSAAPSSGSPRSSAPAGLSHHRGGSARAVSSLGSSFPEVQRPFILVSAVGRVTAPAERALDPSSSFLPEV